MPDQSVQAGNKREGSNKGSDKGSVKSSEYSGTSQSGKTADKHVVIDPHKAKSAITSGERAKVDREKRRETAKKTREAQKGK